MPAYEPGLTIAEVLQSYGLTEAIKLASNESPYPPITAVAEVVAQASDGLNRYPDAAGRSLRGDLADRHGVLPDQVALGNGSCELILLLGQALLDPGTTVVHADPSFAIYPFLAAASGAKAVAVPLADDHGHDLPAMAAAVDERTRLVVICNPNNPTGVYRSAGAIEVFLDGLPDDLPVLVDEAYFDFVSERDAGRTLTLARTRPNLIVTRTFSKAYGLCGLRVGYAIGGAGLVQAIDRVRQPFNVNHIAQLAAREGLRHPAEMDRRIRATISERDRVANRLSDAGQGFTRSQGNFILLRAGSGDADDGRWVHEALLRRGVIVRDGGALGCPGWLRVTIGLPEENDRFLAALAAVRETPTERATEGWQSP